MGVADSELYGRAGRVLHKLAESGGEEDRTRRLLRFVAMECVGDITRAYRGANEDVAIECGV